jgi:hypothetical protein
MSKHKGLRLSMIGALIFLISLPLLAVLPSVIASIGIVGGGALVWGGLMWTIFSSPVPPEEPTPHR